MSAIQNLGGFVAPAANGNEHSAPMAVTPSPMPNLIDLAEGPAQHPTPPVAPSSNAQLNLMDADYPEQAPPSYDSVASRCPAATPTNPAEKGHATSGAGINSHVFQSPQPQQYPMDSSAPTSSGHARSLSLKKGESREPSDVYPTSSASGVLVRAEPGPGPTSLAVTRLTSSRDTLDPPPPCFTRVVLPPSDTVTYERLLTPYVIHGKTGSKFLDGAFGVTPIPAFHKHDIETDDWMRFLESIQAAARFNGGLKAVAGALPVTRHLTFIGSMVSRAVEYGMKKHNTSNVVNLLDVWNERFFHPRRLDVILCKGDFRESGIDRDLPAPDRPHAQPRSKREDDDSSSDSSSSNYEDTNIDRRVQRRQRREERRARKRAHREEAHAVNSSRREEKKAKRRESYRLIVVSTN